MYKQKLLIMFLTLFLLGCTKNTLQDNWFLKNDTILLEKNEWWGPCPMESKCQQSIKLYYSGKFVMEGNENSQKQLRQDSMNEIIYQIKKTRIMEKNCKVVEVLDYGATYKINIEDNMKTIEFPGCEDDLRKIDESIEKSLK